VGAVLGVGQVVCLGAELIAEFGPGHGSPTAVRAAGYHASVGAGW
jgi:hypothetical protein